jgi:hypothetical protein
MALKLTPEVRLIAGKYIGITFVKQLRNQFKQPEDNPQ